MKNEEITIVSAFFDIGRDKYEKISRKNEEYLKYFKFWAHIQNKLIVYTFKDMAKEIESIRDSYGLKDKTTVIVIDDITSIEPLLYENMKKVEDNNYYLSFRYHDDLPENKALYDYIMLLKSWFVKDAVERKLTTDLVAWMDFGYNRAGEVFYDEKDFDFLWKYDFPKKVTYFCVGDIIDKPIFSIVQSFELFIMGSPFIVHSSLASKHWELIKNSMSTLVDVGLLDDDQVLMIMAYRKDKEKFNLVKSDWFMPIKDFGGSHLKVKEKINNRTLKDKLLYKYRIRKRNKRYLKRFSKYFLKDYLG